MIGLFVLATARATLATDGATEPIRIEYRAMAGVGCPSAAQFEDQVFERAKSARAAASSEPARSFVVELGRDGARFIGTLVVGEADGESMARRVTGSTCGDVASVLALATALAIDPRAELAPRHDFEPAPPPPGPKSELPPAASEAGSKAEHRSFAPRLSLGATVAFGATPGPSLGPSVLFALRSRRASLLGEVGLELAYRQAPSELVRDATADFYFLVARPALCLRAFEIDALRAAPCLSTELGSVIGQVSGLPESSQSARFWAVAEALLRLELPLGTAWFASVDGGAAWPLTRYRFIVKNPDTSIHEVPILTAQTAVRLGAEF
ncbi:MAG TPA: hypothetical protein VF989_14870 [Polyangiaceae bacterium]